MIRSLNKLSDLHSEHISEAVRKRYNTIRRFWGRRVSAAASKAIKSAREGATETEIRDAISNEVLIQVSESMQINARHTTSLAKKPSPKENQVEHELGISKKEAEKYKEYLERAKKETTNEEREKLLDDSRTLRFRILSDESNKEWIDDYFSEWPFTKDMYWVSDHFQQLFSYSILQINYELPKCRELYGNKGYGIEDVKSKWRRLIPLMLKIIPDDYLTKYRLKIFEAIDQSIPIDSINVRKTLDDNLEGHFEIAFEILFLYLCKETNSTLIVSARSKTSDMRIVVRAKSPYQLED